MLNERIHDCIKDFCKANGIEPLAAEISKYAATASFHNNAITLYPLLTDEYQSTGELSQRTGIESNYVSYALNTLHESTSLVSMRRDGKLKYWKKK